MHGIIQSCICKNHQSPISFLPYKILTQHVTQFAYTECRAYSIHISHITDDVSDHMKSTIHTISLYIGKFILNAIS